MNINTLTTSFDKQFQTLADGKIYQRMNEDNFSSISKDSPDYEATLRKNIVLNDELIPQNPPSTSNDAVEDFVIADLESLLIEALMTDEAQKSVFFEPAFFIWFEWHNRNNSNRRQVFELWENLFTKVDEDALFKDSSLYYYAKSRWLYQASQTEGVSPTRRKEQLDEAIQAADIAFSKAPNHPGFLNNYGEMLVEEGKREILENKDSRELTHKKQIEMAINDFDRLESFYKGAHCYEDYWRPSFLSTRELLEACVSNNETEITTDGFEAARDLLRHLHQNDDAVFKDQGRYVVEMSHISNAQSLCFLIENAKRLRSMNDEQENRNQLIEKKMDELDKKVVDNRMSIIETLGFFSAIIALIISSVQVSEGLDFGMRTLFILVLTGALLVAFGGLDIIISPYRSQKKEKVAQGFVARIPDRAKMLWFIGLSVIVLGVICAFIFSAI